MPALLQLPEPSHARLLQALARLQKAGTARGGSQIVSPDETEHREVDPPERRIGCCVQLSPPSSLYDTSSERRGP